MKDLIEAPKIFLKYGNPFYPTHCEHYDLKVNINPNQVSIEDIAKLSELGFEARDEFFYSYRFGSC